MMNVLKNTMKNIASINIPKCMHDAYHIKAFSLYRMSKPNMTFKSFLKYLDDYNLYDKYEDDGDNKLNLYEWLYGKGVRFGCDIDKLFNS